MFVARDPSLSIGRSPELPAKEIAMSKLLGELLVVEQIAKSTNTSPSFWEKLRRDGDGPPYINLGRRCYRYRLSDVVQWLESRAVGGGQ